MTISFERSTIMLEQAQAIFPGGVQGSRLPFYPGESPAYMQRGLGPRCWDVDGHEYIDYTLGVGPIILGYAHPAVNAAVAAVLPDGMCFTFNHPLQNELARTLIRLVPGADWACFFKTGSDACTAAVRIARAYTGREKVAHCGYHGWHDWAIFGLDWLSPVGLGVPMVLDEYIAPFDGNDPETLATLLAAEPETYAAVIVAPEEICADHTARLAEIARLARAHGAVFIMDEVKTGFRLALGGAQERFGVTPDLATFSKAMANGFPISAVVGRHELIEAAARARLTSTFNGEIASMAAALATIGELEKEGAIAHIWRMGGRLLAGLNEIIARTGVPAEAVGIPAPPMPFLRFTDDNIERRERLTHAFYTAVMRDGIMLFPDHVWFMSLSHTEAEIDRTLDVCEAAMQAVAGQLAGHISR